MTQNTKRIAVFPANHSVATGITLNVAETLVKFAIPPPIIRILPVRRISLNCQ